MYDYDPHIPHVRGDGHLRSIHLESISALASYSGIILAVIFVILFLLKQFVLEGFLLRRLYGDTYLNLKDIDRRGFANHHIAGGTKLLLLVVGVYPFIDVTFREGTLNKPYSPHSSVTMGDILVVCTNILTAMYVFELIYRVKVSLIGSLHHVGSIIIAQTAIAYSLDRNNAKVAVVEFILVTVWGAFDIVCEMLPHISIVLYRVYNERHLFLMRVFFVAALTTFGGTLFETAVVFYLWGSLWQTWTLEWKIVTPLLHLAFSATQMHGSIIFYKMWKKQRSLIRKEPSDPELAIQRDSSSNDSHEKPSSTQMQKALTDDTQNAATD